MAGLYLIYTAYSLFKGLPETSGTEKLVMTIAIFAFSVIGAVLAVMGVKQGVRDSREEAADVEDEIEGEEDKEPADDVK